MSGISWYGMLSSLTTSFSAEEAAFPQHGRFGHPHPELRTARRRTEGLNCSLNTTLVYSDIYIYCSPSVHNQMFSLSYYIHDCDQFF